MSHLTENTENDKRWSCIRIESFGGDSIAVKGVGKQIVYGIYKGETLTTIMPCKDENLFKKETPAKKFVVHFSDFAKVDLNDILE